MKVKTIDGTMYEIDMAEAERIHREMESRHPSAAAHESNAHYQNRAYLNICKLAKKHGIRNVADDEDDMKKLLLFGMATGDADLVGEVVEWFIAEHAKKVGA
jgi:hypothetical protein